MPKITLAKHMCVLTQARGWQFVDDLNLKDSIQCLNWYDIDSDPKIEWCQICCLDCYRTAYMNFLVSTNFQLIYDNAEVFLQKGDVLKYTNANKIAMDEDFIQHDPFFDNKKSKFSIDYVDEWKIQQCDKEIYIYDENLSKIILNSESNIPNLHTKEHKIWDKVYTFYWDFPCQKSSSKISIPLTKRGRAFYHSDAYSSENEIAVYALNGVKGSE